MSVDKDTSIINRVFFGAITLIFVAGLLKQVYAYTNGADTPPFPFWVLFYGLPILGFVLITLRGDIRLRLHKIWTPVGVLMMIAVVYVLVFVNMPTYSSGLINALTVYSSESLPVVFAFGLLVAFVDLNVLYRYAYFFIPEVIFTIIGIIHDNANAILTLQFSMEPNGVIDDIWFAFGFIFAYYAVKKYQSEHPKLKTVLLYSGAFIGCVISLVLIAQVVAGFLSPGFWLTHWLTAQKAPLNLICVGSGCSLPLYTNIYSMNSSLCIRSNTSFRTGINNFSLVVQDIGVLGCKFMMNTTSNVLTISCMHNIQVGPTSYIGNTVTLTMGVCGSFPSVKPPCRINNTTTIGNSTNIQCGR